MSDNAKLLMLASQHIEAHERLKSDDPVLESAMTFVRDLSTALRAVIAEIQIMKDTCRSIGGEHGHFTCPGSDVLAKEKDA